MKFLLFFGSLFAIFLYRFFGLGIWPFGVFVTVYIWLWAKYGRRSWPPRLFLFGMALAVELQASAIRIGYARFLARRSPATAYWLDPECYGYDGLWREIPRFVGKYSGLRYLWPPDFNHPVYGYTLPELLLLAMCTCALLGLFVALLHRSWLNGLVGDLLSWPLPEKGIFKWFLYVPLQFPQWAGMPFVNEGWRAGIMLAVLPFTLALLLLGVYCYLFYLVFLWFPARVALFFLGADPISFAKADNTRS